MPGVSGGGGPTPSVLGGCPVALLAGLLAGVGDKPAAPSGGADGSAFAADAPGSSSEPGTIGKLGGGAGGVAIRVYLPKTFENNTRNTHKRAVLTSSYRGSIPEAKK